MRLGIFAPDGSAEEVVVEGALVRIGRDPDCEVPLDQAAFPMVSRPDAKIEIKELK